MFTTVLDPSKAIYVPRGVGNSLPGLGGRHRLHHLVDAHWSLELKRTYTFVNLADPELAIEWPIPLAEATVSGPTSTTRCWPTSSPWLPAHPRHRLQRPAGPCGPRAGGGRGVAKDFDFCDIDTFDMSDPDAYSSTTGRSTAP
ncbi:MAG: hypothetical protein ACLU0O_10720 [Collinsella sp.]